MPRTISISLNPNIMADDLRLCWRMWWEQEEVTGANRELKSIIEDYYGKKVVITESGRDGLYLLLKAWGVGKGDEVILQAFTCTVVPAAIMAVGATPVYVDVDEGYNLNLKELPNKISERTKVVIVQHTFGKPVEMKELQKILPKKIRILEDLAHGLGNIYGNKKLGNWGDGAVLSFGRDKVVSGIAGGAVVATEEVVERIEKIVAPWPRRGRGWVKQRLAYPWWMWLVLTTYRWGVGKMLHVMLRKTKLLPDVISRKEKRGMAIKRYQGLPDELAKLVINQWSKLEKMVVIRREAAKLYAHELGEKLDHSSTHLRWTMRVDRPADLRQFAAKRGVFLGDWYDQVVAPISVKVADFGYEMGMAPKAEDYSRKVVNLPTNPNMSAMDLERVVTIIKAWKSER